MLSLLTIFLVLSLFFGLIVSQSKHIKTKKTNSFFSDFKDSLNNAITLILWIPYFIAQITF